MIKIKIHKKIQEAEGDSKELVKINADKIRATREKPSDKSKFRDFEMSIKASAEKGEEPSIFSKKIIDDIEAAPDDLFPKDGRRYFIKWFANVIKSGINPPSGALKLIRDYYISTGLKELEPSYYDALQDAAIWDNQKNQDGEKDSLGEYKTNDIVHKFDNGYRIVRIASSSGNEEDVDHDLRKEGELMRNCIGNFHCDTVKASKETLFSLRDNKNEPHVTINYFLSSDKIGEIKGKGNKEPERKYLTMVYPWIKQNFEKEQYAQAEQGLLLDPTKFGSPQEILEYRMEKIKEEIENIKKYGVGYIQNLVDLYRSFNTSNEESKSELKPVEDEIIDNFSNNKEVGRRLFYLFVNVYNMYNTYLGKNFILKFLDNFPDEKISREQLVSKFQNAKKIEENFKKRFQRLAGIF